MPAIRGTTGSALTNALTVAAASSVAASAALAGVGTPLFAGIAGGVAVGVTAFGQNLWKAHVNSYVDCYRNLDDAFRTTREVPGIGEAAKRVFHRDLADT